MTTAGELDRLQRWMQAVVMHPQGAARGLAAARRRNLLPAALRDLESVVTRSRQLTALARLGVYADMYYLRLIEVLTAEYPTTRDILGADAFNKACRAYIARHPSTERTLQSLSARYPEFLRRHLRGRRNARLAVDVARIERAMEEVFDAPRAEPLAFETLKKIPVERWAEVHLQLTPAVRLLALDCPANEYMTAVRARRKAHAPRARRSFVIVYRYRLRAWRMTITREQFTLLELLGKGWPLGRAVYRSCRKLRVRAQQLPALLSGWFRDWSAAGLFVGVAEPSHS
jgi:hypothetical protein